MRLLFIPFALCLCLALLFVPHGAHAQRDSAPFAPSAVRLSISNISFTSSVTPESIAQVRRKLKSRGEDISQYRVALRSVADKDIAAFCTAFPQTARLDIQGRLTQLDAVSDLSPLSALSNLQELDIQYTAVRDFSPLQNLRRLSKLKIEVAALDGGDVSFLSGMDKLKSLHLTSIAYKEKKLCLAGLENKPGLETLILGGMRLEAPNALASLNGLPSLRQIRFFRCSIGSLAPLATLPKLERLRFFSVHGLDVEPLAACPALKSLNMELVFPLNHTEAFGRMAALEELRAGRAGIKELSWLAGHAALRKLFLYEEDISDFSALGQLPRLERLRLRNMRRPIGDLGFLSGMESLRVLRLEGVEFSNERAIGSLPALRELVLNKVSSRPGRAVDLGFASALPHLIRLQLTGLELKGGRSLRGLRNLEHLEMTYCSGVKNLAPIQTLPNLQRFIVSRGAYPQSKLYPFKDIVLQR